MKNTFYVSWKVTSFQRTTVTNFIAIKMVLTVASLRNSERRGITMAMHIPQASTNVITKIYVFCHRTPPLRLYIFLPTKEFFSWKQYLLKTSFSKLKHSVCLVRRQ
jgi:hypothetical protein